MDPAFTHYDLGWRHRGDVVQVRLLGSAANVRLMSETDFQRYIGGQRYAFYGGLMDRSPIELVVPVAGTWHVVVDLLGVGGSVQSGLLIRSAPAESQDRLTVRT